MSKPILVTGGAGSLGARVVAALRKEGHTVRAFDMPSASFPEEQDGVEICRGDITQVESVNNAVEGTGGVIHLAAMLPPLSEQNRNRTFAVNVEGTRILAEAVSQKRTETAFVFSSSASTFGDTSSEAPPVSVDHPQTALDIYAESKIAAEECLRHACPRATILRISGVAVSEFYEPPATWPFQAEQRIEFVHRDDVVTALCAAVESKKARGRDFIIAGGPTWRMLGVDYVTDYFELLGVPLEEADFQAQPGWCDWYDTSLSQEVLEYQNTTYQDHLVRLQGEMERLLAE